MRWRLGHGPESPHGRAVNGLVSCPLGPRWHPRPPSGRSGSRPWFVAERGRLIGLGSAEAAVKKEGLLPVAPGLPRVADRVVTAGEAVVGAGLPVFVAGLYGESERCGVLLMGLGWPGYGEKSFPETVECGYLAVSVADLAAKRQGSLAVGEGLFVTMLPEVDLANGGEKMRLSQPVAGYGA
jgi:hypothetical protein